MKKTLAICIPTYNRAALLAKNLKVLVPLAQASDCPIYISDNDSPDDTEKVVEEVKKKYDRIHYVRQQENIGFCRNFEYVVNMAETDYVWLLGDDDYLAEGSIEKVLCDFKAHDDACMVVVNAGNNPASIRIKNLKSQLICGKDVIMSEIGAHMTWMSCLVFNKGIMGSVQFHQYEGNAFPHLWWILANLTEQSKIYWESNSCISSFGGGHQMSDFFKVFFADWHDAVYGVEGYSESARKKCFNAGVAYAFTGRELIKLRAKGDLNKNTLQEYRSYFEQLPDDKQKLIKLLLMVPACVCKVAIGMYKGLKSGRRKVIELFNRGKIMKSKFDAINFLRVVATLMVFFLHAAIFKGKSFAGQQMFRDYPITFFFHTPAWAGCWIFFVLGGYLAGLGFKQGRYSYDLPNIMKYYKKKILNVWIPTVGFIFLVAVLAFPGFFVNNPMEILNIFLCKYKGTPGVDGIGATWFVFTIMWLYLFTPFFSKVIKNNKKHITIIFILVTLLGLLLRVFLFKSHADWYTKVYTPMFTNLDLYVSGMCLPFFTQISKKNVLKICSLISLAVLILLNSFWYSKNINIELYQYILPTVYLLVSCMYIYSFCCGKVGENSHKSIVFKVINVFADISFQFYLFHSIVLNRISPFVGGKTSIGQYLKMICFTAIISIILSVGFKKIFTHIKQGVNCKQ